MPNPEFIYRPDASEMSQETKKELIKKFDLNFYFAPHQTEYDFRNLAELLTGADVYLTEMLGWTEGKLQEWKEVAAGERKPEAMSNYQRYPAARKHELDLVYGSQKVVDTLDISADNEIYQKYLEAQQYYTKTQSATQFSEMLHQ